MSNATTTKRAKSNKAIGVRLRDLRAFYGMAERQSKALICTFRLTK